MLTCKDVAERASALIDQELGFWDRLQMRLHLAMCEGCQRFVSQVQVTNELVQAAAPRDAEDVDQQKQIESILSNLSQQREQGR